MLRLQKSSILTGVNDVLGIKYKCFAFSKTCTKSHVTLWAVVIKMTSFTGKIMMLKGQGLSVTGLSPCISSMALPASTCCTV